MLLVLIIHLTRVLSFLFFTSQPAATRRVRAGRAARREGTARTPTTRREGQEEGEEEEGKDKEEEEEGLAAREVAEVDRRTRTGVC